jgi:hypothetical protein
MAQKDVFHTLHKNYIEDLINKDIEEAQQDPKFHEIS